MVHQHSTFFLLGNREEAIKTVCNIFINVEVVVVICIVVYTTCKKNSPNDHLDSGYYPLTQVLRSGVLFLQWSAKVDHWLKIRGKIQALLDLVCDEFKRNDGPSLDREKRVGHRIETFWGNGIRSQVLIGKKRILCNCVR